MIWFIKNVWKFFKGVNIFLLIIWYFDNRITHYTVDEYRKKLENNHAKNLKIVHTM